MAGVGGTGVGDGVGSGVGEGVGLAVGEGVVVRRAAVVGVGVGSTSRVVGMAVSRMTRNVRRSARSAAELAANVVRMGSRS